MATERAPEKRQFGHRARLALSPSQVRFVDAQAHAARATWNLLHGFWTMTPKCRRSLKAADEAIRQARKEIDWLGVLPAQAAQAVHLYRIGHTAVIPAAGRAVVRRTRGVKPVTAR